MKTQINTEQNLKARIDNKYKSLSDAEKPNFVKAMVYEIVDENYGGKIQNFTIYRTPSDGYIISGGFETPRMGGKKLIMGFDIDGIKIVLAPQNLEVLNNSESGSLYLLTLGLINSFSEKTNYYPFEFFSFAQKQMNCTIGWSCKGQNGYACLSKTKKNCNNNLNPNHRTYVSWLKDQIGNKSPDLGFADKPQPVSSFKLSSSQQKSGTEPIIAIKNEVKKTKPILKLNTTIAADELDFNLRLPPIKPKEITKEEEAGLKKFAKWFGSVGNKIDKALSDFLEGVKNKKLSAFWDIKPKITKEQKDKIDDFINFLKEIKEKITQVQYDAISKFVNWLDTNKKSTPKPAPTAKPNVEPAPAKNDGKFPDDLDDLVVVKKLGGTTGAQLVKDPATGKQYVMKKGSSAEHLENEAIADSAYQALGVNVPNHKIYKDANGKPTKLAEYVEGRDLAEINKNGTQQEKDLIKGEIKKHFAADALLGNWDVVGMEKDNIMLGNDGKVYRIDNGGSLGYRAQGAKKDSKLWNKYPLDLWSMRDTKINPYGAEYFGDLTHKEVVAQINDLVSKKDKLNGLFNKDDQDIISGRIEEMKRVANISKTLDEDKWNDDYIGNFTKHTVGIRAAGITDKLPEELKQKSNDIDQFEFTIMVDKNGKDFDDLRGEKSTMFDLDSYMKDSGGDYKIISSWMSGQAGYSWGDSPQAIKYFIANQRDVKKDRFWWGLYSENNNEDKSCKDNYEKFSSKYGKDKFDDTLTMYHAFNYEMLSKMEFPNKNKDGTVTLFRTEASQVMKTYGMKIGDTGYVKRGPMESTSIVKPAYIYTTELTSQTVPIHRIFGTYFTERSPGSNQEAFFGDRENEFLAMLEGIKVKHVSSNPVY